MSNSTDDAQKLARILFIFTMVGIVVYGGAAYLLTR